MEEGQSIYQQTQGPLPRSLAELLLETWKVGEKQAPTEQRCAALQFCLVRPQGAAELLAAASRGWHSLPEERNERPTQLPGADTPKSSVFMAAQFLLIVRGCCVSTLTRSGRSKVKAVGLD